MHISLYWVMFTPQLVSWLVQLLSHVWLFATPWTAAPQASLSSPTPRVYSNSCPLSPWCHPTISSSVVALLLLTSIFPSIRIFSNESDLCIRWPKHWSFSFNISPSNEHPGLSPLEWTGWISLQSKALSSLLQHHSSKASILRCSAFFTVQLMITGKTIAWPDGPLLAK